LTKALDAWKAGTEVSSLADAGAALYVGDEDWSRGNRLVNYTLLDEGKPFGSNVRFVVDLELSSDTGAALSKRVRYVVGTNPVQSVQRDDSEMEDGFDA
jgi:hypothetical protein